MKRILCLTLSMLFILTSVTSVNASILSTNINDANKIDKVDQNIYNIYKLDFSNDSIHSLDNTVDIKNEKDIVGNDLDYKLNKCKEFVKGLNLKSKGFANLEEGLLNEINSYKYEKDVTLDSYEVYIPKINDISTNAIGNEVYYGTYNGYIVHAAYSVSNLRYVKTPTASLLNSFLKGIVNIIMGTAKWEISLTYSAFMALLSIRDQNAIKTYSIDYQETHIPYEHTTKYLLIQDKLNQYPGEEYVMLYKDEAAVYQFRIYTFFVLPHISDVIALGDLTNSNTIDFYNSTNGMRRVWERYMSGSNSIVWDKLPAVYTIYQ